MKLRLDEYYYILNIDSWCEEEYMPENMVLFQEINIL